MIRSGRAKNGDVELAWEQWNEQGDPLLLVNGLGSPCVAYQIGFLEALAERGFAVARFDNRDVGESSRCPGAYPTEATYAVADMARDATAVLDDLGWETSHVFGQSMGGMIVQQMAIDVPERLRSVTSLMSSTGQRGVGKPTAEAMSALMERAPDDRDAWIEHRLRTEKIWASNVELDPAWSKQKAEELFEYGIDADGTARQYKALAGDVRDAGLAQVNLPFLVMHGSADTLINPDGGRHTASVVPGADYVEIQDMGHDLPPMFWDRLANEQRQFVDAIN